MKTLPVFIISIIFTLSFSITSNVMGQTQNEVSVSLTFSPPYSPYFDDYINFEGAILLLQNNTQKKQYIQLRGSIEGDNGLYAYTYPDYVSPSAIQLAPFESMSFYSNSPVFDFMDPANIETNISQQMQDRAWRLGLMPEGNYTICVQAFDYETHEEISLPEPVGCTMIPITHPQPPEIIIPECETSILDPLPTFSWTPVVGNTGGANILYDLYIVRLQPTFSAGVDPYYIMDLAVNYNAGNPLVIRNQQLTNYLYGPGDPPLIPGAQYAVQVIAHDQNNTLVFENDGKSDVCTFTYLPAEEENDDQIGIGLFDTIDFPFHIFKMTTLTGQLFYKFSPGFTGPGTFQTLHTVEQSTVSHFTQASSSEPQLFLDNFMVLTPLYTTPYPEGAQYFDHDLQMISNNDPALSWTTVRLVTRYVHNNHMVHKNTKWISASNNTIPVPNDNGKVLSTTSTDGEGNYDFRFVQPVTGHLGDGLFRVITLEVVSPYFYSPDIKILSIPGDNFQLPDQVALVKTYGLDVYVKSDETENQLKGKDSPIPGVEINVRNDYHFCSAPINRQVTLQQNEANLDLNQIFVQGSSDIFQTKTTGVDGKVSFYGLVKHNAPNILDRLSVKASTPMTNQQGYLYKALMEYYPSGTSYDQQQAFTEFNPDFPLFNSDYELEKYELHLVMEPDNPKIAGRVLFDKVPLEGVGVSLWTKDISLKSDFSDSDGRFLFENVLANNTYDLIFSKAGFPPNRVNLGKVLMGQYIYLEHEMTIPGEVYGYVSNEQGDPVMSDIRFGGGDYIPYIATEIISITEIKTIGTTTGTTKAKVKVEKAKFQSPAFEGENIPLEIIPRSDQYFADTFYLSLPVLDENKAKFIGEFTMFEKLHRIQFKVVSPIPNGMTGYGPVANAKIEIIEQNLSKYTDDKGEAYFKFASPGSYFWVKVTPPEGSDLVPYMEKLYLPITKQDIVKSIILEKGYSINGFVSAGQDSIPLANARVYINSDMYNGQNFIPLMETYSKSDGSFELHGIPFSPSMHTIRAVKSSPDTAFVGDFVLVTQNTQSPVYLNLKILENINLNKIWEMKVEVDELYEEEDKMFISGAFIEIENNPNFQTIDPGTRLQFYNIEVQASSYKDPQGKSYLDPIDDKIPLEISELPVKMQSHFYGSVFSHTFLDPSSNADKLLIKVQKDDNNSGFIKGIAEMDLASFKFSYEYNAEINLADQSENYKVNIFTANPNDSPHTSYHIGKATSSGLEDLSFSVHKFDATADRSKSIFFEDTVKLHTVLHTNVPNCIPSDLEVQAGFIKIIPNNILQIYGGENISFNLEEWDVIGKEAWFFDKNHGGIIIPKARINTHIIDLDVDSLLIKPNDLKIDDPNLAGKVNLAGVTNINILAGNDVVFHFDQSCSSDFSPHWRFSVMPEGINSEMHSAEISNLPGMESNDKIEIGKFSLFSNDEMQMDQFDQTVTFYEVFDLKLYGNALSTYHNSFELHGTYNLGIPNLSANNPAVLQFSKPESEIVMELVPPYLQFTTMGNVKFKANQYKESFNFEPGLFEALGVITISDQGQDIELAGKLTRSLNEIKVDIIQVNNENQRIIFSGQPDKYLEVMEGKMEVKNGAWENLWFDGATIGLGEGVKDPYNNLLHFVAHGSVNVDDGAVEVTGVETPFGGISITMDFIKMSLHGSLSINTPIATGYCTFKSGCGELQIDGSGFYFGLGLTIHILSIPIDIDAAIIIGYYPTFDQHLKDLLNDYSYRDEMPAVFNGGVEGFLFSLSIVAVDVSEEVDIGIAAFSLEAQVGLNFIIYATFNDPPVFGIELTAFAGIAIELSFLCIDLGLFINAELMLGGQISEQGVDLYGCGSLQLGIYYDVCELVADCFSESLRLELWWGSSTGGELDMDASLGGGSCSGNSGFNSDHSPCN